jgi:aspartyl protease family protein
MEALALARTRAPVGGGMIGRAVFFAALGLALALLGPPFLVDRVTAPAPVAASPAPAAVASEDIPPSQEPAARESSGYREALLKADGRGQYAVDALVNGLRVRMLVDTGASDVVVSASTAARLGLVPTGRRARAIQTANGMSTASPAVLDRLSLGGLYMNRVEALILTPEAGEVNLLGESFLKRLMSVEQRDGMLILRQ